MNSKYPILLALLLAVPACPGGMDVSNLPAGHVDGGAGLPQTSPEGSTISTPTDDMLVPQLDGSGQKKPPTADSSPPLAPDSTPPAPTPDTGTPTPPGVGQACPCAAGLVCVGNVCRAKCKAPTDACLVAADCPANNACLATNQGFWVCLPATAQPGQTCGGTKWCPVNYVCGAVGGGSYKCLPTCTGNGTTCGTQGGKCAAATNGCAFCSSL